MTAGDPYRLDRFRTAQDRDATYERALVELRAGRKRSHWMWFVFPQLAGLGLSETSRFFAISSPAEASAYLADPVLGPRLRECARVLVTLEKADAVAVFGGVDAQKLQSSMTLFHRTAPGDPDFAAVLERYFAGVADPVTDRLLAGAAAPGAAAGQDDRAAGAAD
jgi:uncharacterized protein (DUF1810 family)